MTPRQSKKEMLKTEDRFVSFWKRAYDYFNRYQNHILIGVLIVAAVWAGVWGWSKYRQRVESLAWTAYEEIIMANSLPPQATEVQKDRASGRMIQDLNQLIAERTRTKGALQAHLKLASLISEQGDFEAAIAHYQTFLDGLRADDPLRPIVAEALGRCFEASGQYDLAAEWYRRVATAPNLADLGLWDLGRVMELSGQRDEAIKTYLQLTAQHPQSAYASLVNNRLFELTQR
ncbi:MAG: tetratricopeptide repeat protein [Deltaproteobacteria bacterium]|nr:tetratricopeptide repeat protein [Deltaproteobacteria bacterium]